MTRCDYERLELAILRAKCRLNERTPLDRTIALAFEVLAEEIARIKHDDSEATQ